MSSLHRLPTTAPQSTSVVDSRAARVPDQRVRFRNTACRAASRGRRREEGHQSGIARRPRTHLGGSSTSPVMSSMALSSGEDASVSARIEAHGRSLSGYSWLLKTSKVLQWSEVEHDAAGELQRLEACEWGNGTDGREGASIRRPLSCNSLRLDQVVDLQAVLLA